MNIRRALLLITAFMIITSSWCFADAVEPEYSVNGLFELPQSDSRSSDKHSDMELSAALRSLENIEGLQIIQGSGRAILKGELLSTNDLLQINTLSDSFEEVVNMCTLHPDVLFMSSGFIRQALRSAGIEGITINILGNKLLLTGMAASPEEMNTITRILDAYNLPFVDATKPLTSEDRMVMFEVSFTEINRDAIKTLGINWPSSISLADPDGFRIGRLAPAQPLEITINMFVQNGDARIISRPRLVCRSGGKATFQAGGEIPVPHTDSEGQVSVTWKSYGIILQVSPVINPDGSIHSQVHSEVSMVDRANAVEGIPGILTRRIDTSLALKEGETVVMSGLVSSDDAETVKKLPILGDIPVLGELFRSRSFQERKTELIVFLTPHYSEGHDPQSAQQQTSMLRPISTLRQKRRRK